MAETSASGTGTSAWNKDASKFPYADVRFFIRGCDYSYSSYAGAFAFGSSRTTTSKSIGFRTILVAE